ncbi:hypothetical protein BG011_004184 [Mortierella polycephala]|uniref:C2H2-type domain-containing protein n=1 Tax=Mortierella polycephala TaxID=41804 RepID=A0A9P6U2Q9_9FUNG|nr:hypothetical protein BG011_004184 [Mortierella polycephala]
MDQNSAINSYNSHHNDTFLGLSNISQMAQASHTTLSVPTTSNPNTVALIATSSSSASCTTMPSPAIERVTDPAFMAITSENPAAKGDQNAMVPTQAAPFATPCPSSAVVTPLQDDALGDVLFEDSENINRILDRIVNDQGFAMQVDATQLDLTQLPPWTGQAQFCPALHLQGTLVHTSISRLQQQQDQQGYGHFDNFTMNFGPTIPPNIAMGNVLADVAGVSDQVSVDTGVVEDQSLIQVTSSSIGAASSFSSVDLSSFHYQQWLQPMQADLVDQEQSDTVMTESSSFVEGLTEQSIRLMKNLQAQYSTEQLQAVDYLSSREANHDNALKDCQLGLGAQASSSPLTAEGTGESSANFEPSFESMLYSIAETYPLPEFADGQIVLEPQLDDFLSVQAGAYDAPQDHEQVSDMQLPDVKPATAAPQDCPSRSKISNASSNNASDTSNASIDALEVNGEAARVQGKGKRKLAGIKDTDDDHPASHSGSSSASGSSSVLSSSSSSSSLSSSSKASNKQTYSNGMHPHRCTYPNCPRTFATQGLLKSHLVSHQDEKLFWCDLCAYDAVTPKPADDPAYSSPSLPQPEVKRYKRNHDLLRHKREQHPPIEVKIQREAERTAARQARKFLHRVQREERQRAERLANTSADGGGDGEVTRVVKKRKRSGMESVSASTVMAGGVGVMTAAEIHAFLYSQGSPEYNDIGVCPLGTSTNTSTADANASSLPQLQIPTLSTPSTLLSTNTGIPTVSAFPPPLDPHQQQMQQLLQLHQLQQQQLQFQQQIQQQQQQLQGGQGSPPWTGADSTAISDATSTAGTSLLPVHHLPPLHQSPHHSQQQQSSLLQPVLGSTGFIPNTMGIGHGIQPFSVAVPAPSSTAIASLPSSLVNTDMGTLNLTVTPLPAFPALSDNSQQQQEYRPQHGQFSQNNNEFHVARRKGSKTHSAEEISFHPYARGSTSGGRRIGRHGRCASL